MKKNSIRVKRPVKVKTVITDQFKKQAKEEINKEIYLIENQIMQLELQNKQIQDQVNSLSAYYGEQTIEQIQEALEDVSRRLVQMSELKKELQFQKDNIEHLVLDNVIITGSLENYVELAQGENIYDKFREAEIIIKDGIIQEIIE
jgi:hypothetical protein